MTIQVRKIEPSDAEVVEEWTRVTDEQHILGVGAIRNADDTWSWQVMINVAEYVRDEPLVTRLQEAVTSALQAVPGVTQAAQEDREVWVVDGSPTGDALVEAASAAVDSLAAQSRQAYVHLDAVTAE